MERALFPADDETELQAVLALSRVLGLGPRLLTELLDQFGTAQAVLQQTRSTLLPVPGIGGTLVDRILSANPDDGARWLHRCRELNVDLYQPHTRGFPDGLRHIPDPPALLYVRGNLLPQDELSIGIVGSRRCSPYGLRHASRLASSLVRAGFTVVSGLARGIDAAAHLGALNAGGRTIAVMATGVRDIYPPEHTELADRIIDQGALISECPLDQKARRGMFPQRNRLISGLCQGVIIVEATRRSGALHTARHAMEQGRDVFALPGPVDNITSQGCHDLIRDGVPLIRNVDDILDHLGPLAAPAQNPAGAEVHHPREVTLNQRESEILHAIPTTPTSIDDVVRHTQLDVARVLATLTVLEMKRFIRRLPGNMVVRV